MKMYKVSEKLPEDELTVLCYRRPRWYLMFRMDGQWYYDGDEEMVDGEFHPIYWSYLPKSPE